MDLLVLVLVILAFVALGVSAYGTTKTDDLADPSPEIATSPAWATPVLVCGILAMVVAVALLVTGWHPFAVAP